MLNAPETARCEGGALGPFGRGDGSRGGTAETEAAARGEGAEEPGEEGWHVCHGWENEEENWC